MSFYHENVTWQNEDGSWNLGFYKRISRQSYRRDRDYDEEWDAEFDHSKFEYVSFNNLTVSEAYKNSSYPNPGGGETIERNEKTIKMINELDTLADSARVAALKDNSIRVDGKPGDSNPLKVARKSLAEIARFDNKTNKVEINVNSPHEALSSYELAVNHHSITPETRKAIKEHRKKYIQLFKDNELFTSEMKLMSPHALKELKVALASLQKIPITASKASEYSSFEKQAAKERGPKYHVNPETGRAGQCRASKKGCPFGSADAHYANADIARSAYEAKNNNVKTLRRGY